MQSATDLHLWMHQQGLTDEALATRLGMSRRSISYYRSGKRPWSKMFENRVASLLTDEEQGITGSS